MAKTKNKLIDLNDHLFAQMERLSDETLTGEKLNEEIERSRAVTGVGKIIVENAKLALEAQKALGDSIRDIPEMIGISHEPGTPKDS